MEQWQLPANLISRCSYLMCIPHVLICPRAYLMYSFAPCAYLMYSYYMGQPPERARGGILADDMGMGKTLQVRDRLKWPCVRVG